MAQVIGAVDGGASDGSLRTRSQDRWRCCVGFRELPQSYDVVRFGEGAAKTAIQLLKVYPTYSARIPVADLCLVREPHRALSDEMLSVVAVSFEGAEQPFGTVCLKLTRDSKRNSLKEKGRACNEA
jgi:hypothetical protein